jgi:uncharacterized membrane protein YoaK (UPF0700 family)
MEARLRLNWRRLAADPRYGPLPLMLASLTFVAGIVDAVSILRLGHVFVANMTGNVALTGSALAGASGFSALASLLALGWFLVGARIGGSVVRHVAHDRAVLLRAGMVMELLLVSAALAVAAAVGEPFSSASRVVVAAPAAVAMGVQNAIVRGVLVPDVGTPVVTTVLTLLVGHLPGAQGPGSEIRRSLQVVTLFAGAVAGALLVLHVSPVAALGLAVAVLAGMTAAAVVSARRAADWRLA